MTEDVRFSEHLVTNVLDAACCFASDLSSGESAMASRCTAPATVHVLIDPYAAAPTTMTCDEHFHAASRIALDYHLLELVCAPDDSFWIAPWPEKGIHSHCSRSWAETDPTTELENPTDV